MLAQIHLVDLQEDQDLLPDRIEKKDLHQVHQEKVDSLRDHQDVILLEEIFK